MDICDSTRYDRNVEIKLVQSSDLQIKRVECRDRVIGQGLYECT